MGTLAEFGQRKLQEIDQRAQGNRSWLQEAVSQAAEQVRELRSKAKPVDPQPDADKVVVQLGLVLHGWASSLAELSIVGFGQLTSLGLHHYAAAGQADRAGD